MLTDYLYMPYYLEFFQHYEKDADGLCTQLERSVAKQGKAEFFVDRKDFEEAGWIIQEKDLQVSEETNGLFTLLISYCLFFQLFHS